MNSVRPHLLAFLLGVLVGAGIIWVVNNSNRNEKHSQELSTVREELEADKSKLQTLENELSKKTTETYTLGRRVASLIESLKSSDPQAEQEMEDWILRTSTLRNYLDSHPQLKIPEMHFLTTSDWLDAAKEKKFTTEADVRLALAFLRSVAKAKAGMTISHLLTEAQKDGAALPANLSNLTNDPLLKQILGRYSIFDPNHPPQGYWPRGVATVVVETQFAEPGIDQPQWYTREGSFGVTGVSDEPLKAMRAAIDQFHRDRGFAPKTVDDVRTYLKDVPTGAATQDIFDAVQRPAPSG